MTTFNLSEWALQHRSLVWYFMIVSAIAGLFSYFNLGRAEDPDFTIKTMIIEAAWPGATVDETMSQVTDRIEKKLEELPAFEYTRSINSAGVTAIYVDLRATTTGQRVPEAWSRVRNIISDIKPDLPQGVLGPFFNDDFGDVYGNIYAFTSDGLTQRQLRDYVEDVRTKVLAVPDAGKVDLVGAQDEVIYLEFSTRRVAAVGLTQLQVVTALQSQNAITPSGIIEANGERIALRVSGGFETEENLKAVNLRINDRFFRLRDLADIKRTFVDPPTALFSYKGQPAIALGIGMKPGANLTTFGEALKAEMRKIESELPIGVGVHLVSDQPELVEEAVGGFVQALIEAVAIILIVSFLSLGWRAGLVVAITIPLVLAITFVVMDLQAISLQRISLGALIIALGLLVDDATIAVEMMVTRLEAGDPIEKAATHVYTHTAFPMLTGTLATIVGFIPVGLNDSNAGEFTFTLFVVIAVSLIVSWIVAVLFVPLLGVTFLPKTMKSHHEKRGLFSRAFSRLLRFCVRWKWLTIATTFAMFATAMYGMQFVQQQFFPTSDRKEVLVDWTGPQNASIKETRAKLQRFQEATLVGDPDVGHWSAYIGRGGLRFLLTYDPPPPTPNYGQIIVVAKDTQARDRLIAKFRRIAREQFAGVDVFVHPLEIGPPVGRPVQYRVSGPSIPEVRKHAGTLAAIVARQPYIRDLVFDWNEPERVVKVNVLQDKAAQLGVTSTEIATALSGIVGGQAATQVRDGIYLVDVIGRAKAADRSSIETLENLQLSTHSGKTIPLASIASFAYELEQPVVWRRQRVPTITLKSDIAAGVQPDTVVAALKSEVDAFAAQLPAGYRVETGGAVEESAKSQGPIAAAVPAMLVILTTILMIQLQSFQRLFLVFVVAPLGLIGVVAALLASNSPLGFVAILGILALVGILIRNAVILVIQIEELRHEGINGWTAVIEATENRMRPILLTAISACLALIPIAREVFWGPMAFAMIGGIMVGTVLTLLFLPALYVVWFRLKEPSINAPDVAVRGAAVV